jgi:3-phosphoshikimate 1-carboxyvinyltransferase
MHERPQAELFAALRSLGYPVDSANDRLPAVIHGSGPRPGARCRVGIEQSSQFASALLLAQGHGGWEVELEGDDAENASYARMTAELMDRFQPGGQFQIEPDASSASYFWGARWLLQASQWDIVAPPSSSLQIDARFPKLLQDFPESLSRKSDLGDSIMTAIVLAPFSGSQKTFTGLGRLRLQECERVYALRTELTRCGAVVEETGDTLRVFPGGLHGAEIETYNDHRMAMCFAMLGLKVPGMKIRNPGCVAKTFPNFFQKLAQLGAKVLDSEGRNVSMD